MTDKSPRDHARARLIWANVLEALDGDSTDAMAALIKHAEKADNADDAIDELVLLMTTTAALFGRHLEGFLGPDKTREFLHLLLLNNDITALEEGTATWGEV